MSAVATFLHYASRRDLIELRADNCYWTPRWVAELAQHTCKHISYLSFRDAVQEALGLMEFDPELREASRAVLALGGMASLVELLVCRYEEGPTRE